MKRKVTTKAEVTEWHKYMNYGEKDSEEESNQVNTMIIIRAHTSMK